MVQLVATADASEAGRIERKARNQGFPTEISNELAAALGQRLYKVRAGPFETKAEGKAALDAIKKKTGIAGWLHLRRRAD